MQLRKFQVVYMFSPLRLARPIEPSQNYLFLARHRFNIADCSQGSKKISNGSPKLGPS